MAIVEQAEPGRIIVPLEHLTLFELFTALEDIWQRGEFAALPPHEMAVAIFDNVNALREMSEK